MCINILKDKNSDMFRIFWDPSSESVKRASLKLLVMYTHNTSHVISVKHV